MLDVKAVGRHSFCPSSATVIDYSSRLWTGPSYAPRRNVTITPPPEETFDCGWQTLLSERNLAGLGRLGEFVA
jgi:hypothetical protein